jgi:hypothetical protein
MSIVSFLIAVCMVGSGLTGTPAAADQIAAPTAVVDQGASTGMDDEVVEGSSKHAE